MKCTKHTTVNLFYSHQQLSYQQLQASPEHPLRPRSIYQAHLLLLSASFAFVEARLHADSVGHETELDFNVHFWTDFPQQQTQVLVRLPSTKTTDKT